jgi:hypothetical protein
MFRCGEKGGRGEQPRRGSPPLLFFASFRPIPYDGSDADEGVRGDSTFGKAGMGGGAMERQPSTLEHPSDPSVITVAGNDGKELAPGTLNATLKKAGLK